MENKHAYFIEIFKYPILVFSIVLAVLILKVSLGLEFGVVTELSTSGLKFSEQSNQAALKAISELELKLGELSLKVEALEEGGHPESAMVQNNFTATQEVSDSTAAIARLTAGTQDSKPTVLTGYMFIGNYTKDWDKTTIGRLDTGYGNTTPPAEMRQGMQYRVLGNMVIRDGLPPNTDEYYRARANIGVVPRNSLVTLLDNPEAVKRDSVVQYWAKVEYIKDDSNLPRTKSN